MGDQGGRPGGTYPGTASEAGCSLHSGRASPLCVCGEGGADAQGRAPGVYRQRGIQLLSGSAVP